MKKVIKKQNKREKRRARVRAVVIGTNVRPRLNVFRSLRGIYAQLIDDAKGRTLVAVNSKTIKAGKKVENYKGKSAMAYSVGLELATKAKEKKITKAVFDRAGYRYHGRVKAVSDGAIAGGLQF